MMKKTKLQRREATVATDIRRRPRMKSGRESNAIGVMDLGITAVIVLQNPLSRLKPKLRLIIKI